MAKDSGINRTINIPQANIFGRIGTGIGQGLGEQIPKEIERGRLASGLKELGDQKGLSPFQQFSALAGVPGVADRPQLLQTAGDLLRQQAIIDSTKPSPDQPRNAKETTDYITDKINNIPSATTTESTEAALRPYIPPSGPEQENLARKLLASEPNVYRSIDEARNAIAGQVAANTAQSNAKLAKRQTEEAVQNSAENKLREEIATRGAKVPGTVLSSLQQKAVDDVTTKKLSPDQAKIVYGEEADKASKDFANISSWGNLGLVTKNAGDLIKSIQVLQKNAKKNGYQKDAADSLIADNGLTPRFSYATMYPVSDIKPLNDEIKSLPNIKPQLEKVVGAGPGLAGIGKSRPKNENADQLTLQIAPILSRAMGLEGSPLAVGYELDKKGYNADIWKKYLVDNIDSLNLSSHQKDELEKPNPSFFGWLNDWWLQSFSGVK